MNEIDRTYFGRVWTHFVGSINTDVIVNKVISVALTILVMWIASKVLTATIKRTLKLTRKSPQKPSPL